ncbi:MAG: OmpA family protein [Verrucomicrobiota bacterium]
MPSSVPTTWLVLGLVSLLTFQAGAETITENIFFLKPDGKSYLNYRTTRSSHSSYNLYLKKDETEGAFHYIAPDKYTFDKKSDPKRNIIVFPQGDHSTMRPGKFTNEQVTQGKDGLFTYVNWNKDTSPPRDDGHFGEWTAPDNFHQYVFAWVLPDNFEFVDYECNRSNGENHNEWRVRNNTLAWFGYDVNDLVFKINYRSKSSQTATTIRASLNLDSVADDVTVSTAEEGVRVCFTDQYLFAPGEIEISERGQEVLGRLSEVLLASNGHQIVVEGHTDNQAIEASKFASNWELSSARSLAVLKFLQKTGMDGKNLEARAYGEFRPRESNDSEEGRAANRRIEILILKSKSD